MALSPGDRLGVYEVTAEIGAGGMGIVYRARDTKLGRDVALKVLPDLFADDPERLARFQREAKVLASLNHPNIASIYGLEESAGVRALVLELVEGPTLAERIAQGAIPIDEALPIAKQIADALEAAHEAGVIHRDLKPANVKVKDDGMVKVLDFGLAKALGPESGGDPSQSPTMTSAATRMGVIMGTAAYMSPEQARGKPVDKRADVWAYGAVLFEMLTGQRPFQGRDASEMLAAVMMKEPEWPALPANIPAPLSRLLRRCLEKDPKDRLRDIGDARVEVREAGGVPPTTDAPTAPVTQLARWRQVLPWALGALIVGSLLTGLAVWSVMRPAPSRLVRFTMSPDGNRALTIAAASSDVAISPDGEHIAYFTGGTSVGGAELLHVRSLDQLTSATLAAGSGPFNAFFSPDSEWVGFYDQPGPTLKRVSVMGGPTRTICELPTNLRGASWGADDTIIFGTVDNGLWRVAAVGGEPQPLTMPDQERGEVDHRWPEILPGGEAVVFTITGASVEESQIAVLSLDTLEQKVIIRGGSYPRYAPTGHLVYGIQGNLWAVRFDLDRLETLGDPVPVQEGVLTKGSGAVTFGFSETGSLIYVPQDAGSARTLVWVDRQGRESPLAITPRAYNWPRISPDGQKVIVDVGEDNADLWLYDLETLVEEKFTFDPGSDRWPIWSMDGSEIVFSSNRGGGAENLYVKAAGGGGRVERLTESPLVQAAYDWAADGDTLVFAEVELSPVQLDTSTLRVRGSSPPQKLLSTEAWEWLPAVSPDGRWLAYESRESGSAEVYVRPFPNVSSGQWLISAGGGTEPLWGPDGRELFYRSPEGVMLVQVEAEDTFARGTPRRMFPKRYYTGVGTGWDISPDGERFLMIDADAVAEDLQIHVVLNWFEELKQRVPVN